MTNLDGTRAPRRRSRSVAAALAVTLGLGAGVLPVHVIDEVLVRSSAAPGSGGHHVGATA